MALHTACMNPVRLSGFPRSDQSATPVKAVGAALSWFWDNSNLEVLRSGVFHFNKASLAIQHKFGFVETGTGPLLCLARGEEVRHIDTELTRQAWDERRAA